MKLNRTLKRILAVTGVLVAALLAWEIYDYDWIERCLDHGGSWDYGREVCDFEVSHPVP
jgi:hypothetical protein